MSRSAPSGAGASATRRREPTVSTTAAWAASRRGARRWTRWRGCWSCSTPATGTSRPSTSTRSWWPITASSAATTGLRLSLQAHGRRRAAPRRGAHRRGAHRRKRPRRALPGMMLHQDGSSHAWVPARWWDLIVTMDDATSEIYSAFFVAEEGTMSSFQGVSEAIRAKGCSARSTPTAPATTGTRPRPAARWTRTPRPRSAAPWRSSASS